MTIPFILTVSTENNTFFYYFEATVRKFHCSLEDTKIVIK